MLLSLQGLANTDAPRVFIEYPEAWHFHDFLPLKNFYATRYGIKRSWTLTDKVHIVKIVVAGAHRSGATGNRVAVDALIVG